MCIFIPKVSVFLNFIRVPARLRLSGGYTWQDFYNKSGNLILLGIESFSLNRRVQYAALFMLPFKMDKNIKTVKKNHAAEIRPYTRRDIKDILKLYYDTVHKVNAKDYSPTQLNAWAPKDPDAYAWSSFMEKKHTLVAVKSEDIVGFGNLTENGKHVDMLYVHKDLQRKGIGGALLNKLEETVKKNGGSRIELEASITSRPFFERQGYVFVRDNKKVRRGVELKNFVMKKKVQSFYTHPGITSYHSIYAAKSSRYSTSSAQLFFPDSLCSNACVQRGYCCNII